MITEPLVKKIYIQRYKVVSKFKANSKGVLDKISQDT